MTSFKQPSFQHRASQAADAKEKALEQLRLRPEPDEKKLAERKATAARRKAAHAEKSVAKKAAAEAAAQSKAKAAAKAAAPVLAKPTGRPRGTPVMPQERPADNGPKVRLPRTPAIITAIRRSGWEER